MNIESITIGGRANHLSAPRIKHLKFIAIGRVFHSANIVTQMHHMLWQVMLPFAATGTKHLTNTVYFSAIKHYVSYRRRISDVEHGSRVTGPVRVSESRMQIHPSVSMSSSILRFAWGHSLLPKCLSACLPFCFSLSPAPLSLCLPLSPLSLCKWKGTHRSHAGRRACAGMDSSTHGRRYQLQGLSVSCCTRGTY